MTEMIEAAAERGAARALAAAPVPRLAWSVAETAGSLGTSRETVRRLIRDGYLPVVPHMGNRQLIPVVALEEFVRSGR